jgi:4-carboxymuconolactone decarboxylase
MYLVKNIILTNENHPLNLSHGEERHPIPDPARMSGTLLARQKWSMRIDMTGKVPSERFVEGTATRRAVLGDAHVDRAKAGETEFDAPFQTLITEAAWGSVWSRPGWSKRERSIVTIALLAALGHHEEVAMHVRATANTGATPEDLREAMLHVAIYAGVPAANSAIKIVKQTLADMDEAGKPRGGQS